MIKADYYARDDYAMSMEFLSRDIYSIMAFKIIVSCFEIYRNANTP